jgi:DNA polymerase III subunit epsilon
MARQRKPSATTALVDGLEVTIYQWSPWPADLFTKAQLSEKGFRPGTLAGVIRRSDSPDGWMRLYRLEDAIPKRKVSEATKAKLRAAQDRAHTCSGCGGRLYAPEELRIRYCFSCQEEAERDAEREQIEHDRIEAAREAYELICAGDFVVWDSETTDLSGKFIEIAAVDQRGKVLFDSRIRPGVLCEPKAYAVHGIRDEEIASAPTFYEVYHDLRRALHRQHWVIYNSSFDTGILRAETSDENAAYYDYYPIRATETTCAMTLFAEFYGELHSYYKTYTWQKLSTAAACFDIQVDLPAHSALGDCLTTLEVLYAMADWYQKETL